MIPRSGSFRTMMVALPFVLAALAPIAWAQTTDQSAMMASFVCRPALANETANAKMMDSSTTLVCKPFAVAERMSNGSMKTIGNVTVKAPQPGPDFSHALTAQQANAAYNAWVNKTFHIDPAREHTN